MSRYINADELLKTLNREKIPYNSDINYFICHATTADVRPVVVGKWIDTDPSEPLDPRVTCSICGNTEVLNKANYCPNCGSDMRGEQINE